MDIYFCYLFLSPFFLFIHTFSHFLFRVLNRFDLPDGVNALDNFLDLSTFGIYSHFISSYLLQLSDSQFIFALFFVEFVRRDGEVCGRTPPEQSGRAAAREATVKRGDN